jgi:hypothetical protein
MGAEELARKYRDELKGVLLASAYDVQDAAKKLLSQPGKGIDYSKTGDRPHRRAVLDADGKQRVNKKGELVWRHDMPNRSSKPGDPPAGQTGNGRQSVQVDDSKIDQLEVRVGTNSIYMAHHEAPQDGSPARPWLLPAYRKVKDKIRARFDALKRR